MKIKKSMKKEKQKRKMFNKHNKIVILLLFFILFLPFASATSFYNVENIFPLNQFLKISKSLYVNNTLNASEICINGDCQTSWPVGTNVSYNYVNNGTDWTGMKSTSEGILQMEVTSASVSESDGDFTTYGDVIPATDNTYDLGKTNSIWQYIFAYHIDVNENLNVGKNITFDDGGYMYDNGTALILGHN